MSFSAGIYSLRTWNNLKKKKSATVAPQNKKLIDMDTDVGEIDMKALTS